MLLDTESLVTVELTLGFSHSLALSLSLPFFQLKILDSQMLTEVFLGDLHVSLKLEEFP